MRLEGPKAPLGLLLGVAGVLVMEAVRVQAAKGFPVPVGSDHPDIQALDSMIDAFAVASLRETRDVLAPRLESAATLLARED